MQAVLTKREKLFIINEKGKGVHDENAADNNDRGRGIKSDPAF